MPQSGRAPSLHPCVDCQRRKVKCDRLQPCSNCTRYGVECRQPEAHREPRRPRRARDSAMLDRIQLLERSLQELRSSIAPGAGAGAGGGTDAGAGAPAGAHVGTTNAANIANVAAGEALLGLASASSSTGRMKTRSRPVENESISPPATGPSPGSASGLNGYPASASSGAGATPPSTTGSSGLGAEGEKGVLPDEMGRLYIEEGKERYIAGGSWANLANGVADLRTLLEERERRADYALQEEFIQESLIPPLRAGGEPFNPTVDERRKFWQLYVENVDPMVKLLHIPDWTKVMEASWVNPAAVDKSTHSLICAINFAAITSLTEETCEMMFGRPRDWMLKKSRCALTVALRAANFLTSQQSTTLKALILLILCNRRHQEPRVSWIMCGTAFRIAQSLGLHRDGTAMKLAPYYIQDRRRTWWLLRMVDAACAEDCGFMPTQIYGEDTRMPYNLNDSDIKIGDREIPKQKEEFTDVTFSLIRYAINSYMPIIHQRVSSVPKLSRDGSQTYLSEAAKLFEEKQQWMEDHLFRICDPNIPLQRMAIAIGKVILAKLYLVVHIPVIRGEGGSNAALTPLRDSVFVKSCEIIERVRDLRKDPETSKWCWLPATYMEWHAMAYLLSELARDPTHELSPRGWQAVDEALTTTHGVTADLRRALWKPLLPLLEKAEAAAKSANSTDSPVVFPDLQRQLQAANLPGMPDSQMANFGNDFDFFGMPDLTSMSANTDMVDVMDTSGYNAHLTDMFGFGMVPSFGGFGGFGALSSEGMTQSIVNPQQSPSSQNRGQMQESAPAQQRTDWWIPGSPGR